MEFLLVLAGTSSLWVPVWYVARKTQRWYGWDYASVLGPIPFWFMLMTMGVGPMSLSNLFVELLAIAAFVPVAVSLRVFLLTGISATRDALQSSTSGNAKQIAQTTLESRASLLRLA